MFSFLMEQSNLLRDYNNVDDDTAALGIRQWVLVNGSSAQYKLF